LLAYNANSRAIHTETFDGPLELLLFLVRREGVDIREIRIAPITDAYLAHLSVLERFDLNTAGDFLVLAATLCFLKSRELLPKRDGVQAEEDDPEAIKDALAMRLLNYERYRQASQKLIDRPLLDRDLFASRPVLENPNQRTVESKVDPLGLLEIYHSILQRHAAPEPVHSVQRQTYSLRRMAEWIVKQTTDTTRELSELLAVLPSRLDRVVAFIATLELAKMQILEIDQAHHLGPIRMTGRGEIDADLRILAGEI